MIEKRKFDVAALVRDVGGATKAARITGKNRTTPYRWIAQGHISSRLLELIKEAMPEIDMNKYFDT